MAKNQKNTQDYRGDYLFAMSHAQSIDSTGNIIKMIPIVCFTALVILIVRMHTYYRPMTQFFWTKDTDTTQISDFFSYNKMVIICVSAGLALLILLFRLTTQSLTIKRCYAYIPMGVYALFVILSYIFSQYKEFALWGWNDRFEGTLPILAYMIMLFFIINGVNNETNVKQIIIPLAISAFLLSLLGLSQALDHDFFRTTIGQKLLVPNLQLVDGGTTWEAIDQAVANGELYLRFTFNNKEIYQTVYNINYVSFYLTLLVPLFVMVFIRAFNDKETKLWKKIALGVLIALLIYNLIGSQSSGGYLGIGVAFIIALVLFNKQLLKWIKPLIVVIVIIAIVMVATFGRWWPEISGAVKSVLGIADDTAVSEEQAAEKDTAVIHEAGSIAPKIDYMITNGNTITMSLNGNEVIGAVQLDGNNVTGFTLSDKEGQVLSMASSEESGLYEILDERFHDYLTVALAYDGNQYLIQFITGGTPWTFVPSNGEMYFLAGTQKLVKLEKIETWGFESNRGFGSGRGGIWAHSFPLLKKTIFIGTGADTYCAVYPQHDYADKYDSGRGAANNGLYLIVDKPHNMYLHMAIGTGIISLLAILLLYGTYLVQSFKLFWKRDLENDFLSYAGVGTFLGCTGFMVTGLVDDSTVSVMPMFYGLLGMGIAINMIIKRRDDKALATGKSK